MFALGSFATFHWIIRIHYPVFFSPFRVRRFTEITGITEITTESTEITEITIEFTKVWFNGVHYTTIYYCKLYFNNCLHDFVIKQINLLLLLIRILKSPTKLQPVPQTRGISDYKFIHIFELCNYSLKCKGNMY